MSLTWIGHAGFVLELKEATIYIDCWPGNPKCPDDFKTVELAVQKKKPDFVLVTHGHFDHCGSAPAICKSSGATLICIHELTHWAQTNGVAQDKIVGMNKGGTVDLGNTGVRVTMVGAEHSSSCPGDENHKHFITGGEAAGFVVHCTDGNVVYHSGDTNCFSDMKLICDLYNPNIALLCIGGHYTCSPHEASYAIDKLLPTIKGVVPMHFGTFPMLKGTPEELVQKVTRKDVKITTLQPGKETALSKLVQ